MGIRYRDSQKTFFCICIEKLPVKSSSSTGMGLRQSKITPGKYKRKRLKLLSGQGGNTTSPTD
jgi:hypothetical protein